jgi:hypothetical protein
MKKNAEEIMQSTEIGWGLCNYLSYLSCKVRVEDLQAIAHTDREKMWIRGDPKMVRSKKTWMKRMDKKRPWARTLEHCCSASSFFSSSNSWGATNAETSSIVTERSYIFT